jgi:hypothetical protein
MKYNLNNYLICNHDYLNYFIKKHNFTEAEYTYFVSKNHNQNHNLAILLPYLFSLSKITEQECEYFKMFYFNYLEKSNLHIDFPYDSNKQSIIEYIQKDITLTITFIIAAQYYFL